MTCATMITNVCEEVEKEMLDFLLQYTPCGTMTVDEVKTIARVARAKAFEALDKVMAAEGLR